MAPSSSSSPSSSSKHLPAPLPHHSPHFTPVSTFFTSQETNIIHTIYIIVFNFIPTFMLVDLFLDCRFKNVKENSNFQSTAKEWRISTTQHLFIILVTKSTNPTPRNGTSRAKKKTVLLFLATSASHTLVIRRFLWFLLIMETPMLVPLTNGHCLLLAQMLSLNQFFNL